MRPVRLSSVCLLATALMSLNAFPITIEARADCVTPMAGTTDETYAPSFVSVRANQDASSRFVRGKIMWHSSAFLWYFGSARSAGNLPYGFEIETHFYNYDDAAATGLGPAYMLDFKCDPTNLLISGTCQGTPGGWSTCDLPACYLDTQAGSAKNSVGEYAQPNLAFGSFDATQIIATRLYDYGARAFTGRGNKSAMKLNFQLTRPITTIGYPSPATQFACRFTPTVTGDVDLIPMTINELTFSRIFAPACVGVTYKNFGITKQYAFC